MVLYFIFSMIKRGVTMAVIVW